MSWLGPVGLDQTETGSQSVCDGGKGQQGGCLREVSLPSLSSSYCICDPGQVNEALPLN